MAGPPQPDAPAPPGDDLDVAEPPGRPKWTKRRAEAFLKSCPRRRILVPRTSDEEAHEVRTGQPVYKFVGWNGWPWMVPVGQYVDVPEPIAHILEQSQQIARTTQFIERRTEVAPLNEGEMGVKVEM